MVDCYTLFFMYTHAVMYEGTVTLLVNSPKLLMFHIVNNIIVKDDLASHL